MHKQSIQDLLSLDDYLRAEYKDSPERLKKIEQNAKKLVMKAKKNTFKIIIEAPKLPARFTGKYTLKLVKGILENELNIVNCGYTNVLLRIKKTS
jgi:Txe/YoeB family toxin of Txe-Axe toxin-antitoxin module